MKFLFDYGWIIAVVIVAIAYFVFLYRKYGKKAMLEEMKHQAYLLMLAAEQKYGSGTGPVKFQWVVDQFYPLLPWTFRKIWTKEQTGVFVQELFDKMKDYLKKSTPV